MLWRNTLDIKLCIIPENRIELIRQSLDGRFYTPLNYSTGNHNGKPPDSSRLLMIQPDVTETWKKNSILIIS